MVGYKCFSIPAVPITTNPGFAQRLRNGIDIESGVTLPISVAPTLCFNISVLTRRSAQVGSAHFPQAARN
jgi:hypothetical protein